MVHHQQRQQKYDYTVATADNDDPCGIFAALDPKPDPRDIERVRQGLDPIGYGTGCTTPRELTETLPPVVVVDQSKEATTKKPAPWSNLLGIFPTKSPSDKDAAPTVPPTTVAKDDAKAANDEEVREGAEQDKETPGTDIAASAGKGWKAIRGIFSKNDKSEEEPKPDEAAEKAAKNDDDKSQKTAEGLENSSIADAPREAPPPPHYIKKMHPIEALEDVSYIAEDEAPCGLDMLVEDTKVCPLAKMTGFRKLKDSVWAAPKEVDFDRNPTKLFSLLYRKDWDAAVARVNTHPKEAGISVYRLEEDGELRWRILPIHGAVIYDAPEKVVLALLMNYPLGASRQDDKGNLPLHVAYRTKSPEAIIKMLMWAYPEAVEVVNDKGLTPRLNIDIKTAVGDGSLPFSAEVLAAASSTTTTPLTLMTAGQPDPRATSILQTDSKETTYTVESSVKRAYNDIMQQIAMINAPTDRTVASGQDDDTAATPQAEDDEVSVAQDQDEITTAQLNVDSNLESVVTIDNESSIARFNDVIEKAQLNADADDKSKSSASQPRKDAETRTATKKDSSVKAKLKKMEKRVARKTPKPTTEDESGSEALKMIDEATAALEESPTKESPQEVPRSILKSASRESKASRGSRLSRKSAAHSVSSRSQASADLIQPPSLVRTWSSKTAESSTAVPVKLPPSVKRVAKEAKKAEKAVKAEIAAADKPAPEETKPVEKLTLGERLAAASNRVPLDEAVPVIPSPNGQRLAAASNQMPFDQSAPVIQAPVGRAMSMY